VKLKEKVILLSQKGLNMPKFFFKDCSPLIQSYFFARITFFFAIRVLQQWHERKAFLAQPICLSEHLLHFWSLTIFMLEKLPDQNELQSI